jgi:hypothetical protein
MPSALFHNLFVERIYFNATQSSPEEISLHGDTDVANLKPFCWQIFEFNNENNSDLMIFGVVKQPCFCI